MYCGATGRGTQGVSRGGAATIRAHIAPAPEEGNGVFEFLGKQAQVPIAGTFTPLAPFAVK